MFSWLTRDHKQHKLWRTKDRYWVVLQLSVRRDSAWTPSVCVIMNSSVLCPVSGAPLWPYAPLLLFTLNGHRHMRSRMLQTHTQFGNVYLWSHIFIHLHQGQQLHIKQSPVPSSLSQQLRRVQLLIWTACQVCYHRQTKCFCLECIKRIGGATKPPCHLDWCK